MQSLLPIIGQQTPHHWVRRHPQVQLLETLQDMARLVQASLCRELTGTTTPRICSRRTSCVASATLVYILRTWQLALPGGCIPPYIFARCLRRASHASHKLSGIRPEQQCQLETLSTQIVSTSGDPESPAGLIRLQKHERHRMTHLLIDT